MGIPWNYGPRQFDVEAGKSSLVQLNVPHRGTIRSLSLSAPGGGAGAFEIYSSENAARRAVAEDNGDEFSSSAGTEDFVPVASQLLNGTLVSGATLQGNLNVPYVNSDGSPTNAIQRLWMRLSPDGSGFLSFVLSMVIETPRL